MTSTSSKRRMVNQTQSVLANEKEVKTKEEAASIVPTLKGAKTDSEEESSEEEFHQKLTSKSSERKLMPVPKTKSSSKTDDHKIVLKDEVHQLQSKRDIENQATLVVKMDPKDQNVRLKLSLKLDIDGEMIAEEDSKQPMNEAEGKITPDVEDMSLLQASLREKLDKMNQKKF